MFGRGSLSPGPASLPPYSSGCVCESGGAGGGGWRGREEGCAGPWEQQEEEQESWIMVGEGLVSAGLRPSPRSSGLKILGQAARHGGQLVPATGGTSWSGRGGMLTVTPALVPLRLTCLLEHFLQSTNTPHWSPSPPVTDTQAWWAWE